MKTSTPSDANRSALSTALIPARIARIRAMAAPKSPGPETSGPPNRSAEALASAHERAALSTPLEGTQPKFRQSPPMRFRSTSATRAPSAAPMATLTNPPVPAPITTRS